MPITIRLEKLDLFCDQIRNHQDKVLELECKDTLIISDLKKIYGAISENPRITELTLHTTFWSNLSELERYGCIADLKQLKKINLLCAESDTILHIIKGNPSVTHVSCQSLRLSLVKIADFFNAIIQNRNLQLVNFENVSIVCFLPLKSGLSFNSTDSMSSIVESEFLKLLAHMKNNKVVNLSIKEMYFSDYYTNCTSIVPIQSVSKDKWLEAISHDVKKEVAVETLPLYQFFNKTELVKSDKATTCEDRKALVVASK
jgi:hypothetical protein